MDPDQFRVLGLMMRGMGAFLGSGERHGGFDLPDEDEPHATAEVYDELMVILGILSGEGLDHQVVDVGDGTKVLVDSGTLADPAKMEKLRRDYHDWAERRRRDGEELRGIAQASGLGAPEPEQE